MEYIECIDVDTSLPFFWDLLETALYTEGRLSAEYKFWLEFFKDSKVLSEFKERVSRARRGFINWDFIKPDDENLRNGSMAQQYRKALEYVKECLRGTNFVKKNLDKLQEYANEVVSNRQAALERHKNDGNTRAQQVHQEIFNKWVEIKNVISELIDMT